MIRFPAPKSQALLALGLIAAITLGHYLTGVQHVGSHNIYRRLFYLPVVLAAFSFGLSGGLGAALLSSLAYLPHAFFMSSQHRDPAPTIDKLFEVLLYFAVGGLTGLLVEHQRKINRTLMVSIQERDALADELIRAGKLSALGELLAGVAHEIRNPLASIMGAAEGLALALPPEHSKQRLVELQLREIARLNRVVSDFLTFARPSLQARAHVSLRPLLEEIISLVQHHDEEAQFEIEIPKEASIWADRDQIAQVLLNLSLNSLAAQEEPAQIRFCACTRSVVEQLHDCIGVEDRGPGIAKEDLDKIFNPYFSTKPTGSGLGLSISSRIVEAHGGFLDVESRPGRTIFWICLPREEQKI